MEFRWVSVIALWTFLIGPVLDRPAAASSRAGPKPAVKAAARP
jgi:hypothetical protein